MSDFVSKRNIQKCRKQHRCYWCGGLILIGESATVYFSSDDGTGVTSYFHSDCDNACASSDCDEEFWESFSRYTMRRGQTVAEHAELSRGISQS